MTLDDDQSILYVADTGARRIDSVNYDTKTLELTNSGTCLTTSLYEGLKDLG